MKTGYLAVAFPIMLSLPSQALTSFEEVRSVIMSSPALEATIEATAEVKQERALYMHDQLPQYKISIAKVLSYGVDSLAKAAKKTINEDVDYYPRINKLVHSNGICFTGTWNITEANPFSGQFEQGTRDLLVARVSAATSQTRPGSRAFGLALKIFPTQDVSEKVQTAQVFTVDRLLGTDIQHFLETSVTNQPDVGLPSLGQFFDGTIPLGNFIKSQLEKADANIGFRPLYLVSTLGLKAGEAERTPHWVKLQAVEGTELVDLPDFRNELNIARHYPHGIRLDILVSEVTHDRNSDKGWKNIGYIELKESIVSYGCDRQLHFHHPKLRAKDLAQINGVIQY